MNVSRREAAEGNSLCPPRRVFCAQNWGSRDSFGKMPSACLHRHFWARDVYKRQSQVGEGTCFYYCLPCRERGEEMDAREQASREQASREQAAQRERTAAEKAAPELGNIAGVSSDTIPGVPATRLLVVDDDESTLRMLGRVFGKLGVSADCYTSPDEALEQLRAGAGEYTALITDYQMDGMNGAELAAAARFLKPELKILVISGLIKSELIDACQRGRIDGYLLKPVRAEQITEFVKNGKI